MDPCEDPDSVIVRLRDGIDLNDLNRPGSEGVTFEIREEESNEDETVTNDYFAPEEVFNNLYNFQEEEAADSDDERTPFEVMASKMESITEDKGVLKKVLQPGSGNLVPDGALVKVHYNGFLEYSDQPYDSSRLRNELKIFRLGKGNVIPAWDIAIATMKSGELSRYLVQPEYAFGQHGCPPRVPTDATIMFEIELVSFVDRAGVDDFYYMTSEEKRAVTYEQMERMCSALRVEGNQLFKDNQCAKALTKYRKGLQMFEDYHLKNAEEEDKQKKMLLRFYNNMAVCCNKMRQSGRTITYCKKALDIDGKNVKALFKYGQALHQLSEFSRARDYLLRAQKLQPHDPQIVSELQKLERNKRSFSLMEKDMCKKMFSQPTGDTEHDDSYARKAEAKALACTDDFKNLVRRKLLEFKSDPDLMEQPFPTVSLTVAEVACILETAEDLGLDARQRGSGQNMSLKIVKKSPET